MVVDDDPAIAALMASLVIKGGGSVCAVVGSGEEALDVLDRGGDVASPDLVLLDVNLPGIDGIETARRLALSGPGSPRVVLTSTSSLDDLPADTVGGAVSRFVPKSELSPELVGQLLAG